jgi:hypothetical protein
MGATAETKHGDDRDNEEEEITHASTLHASGAFGEKSLYRSCTQPEVRAYYGPPKKGAYWFRLLTRDAGGMSWTPGWPRKISGQTDKRES